VIAWAQYEKWWEQRQKRSGQLFYGCDDVAGVTYVRGGDIIDDYPPTLTSPQQLESPHHHPQHRSHQHLQRCHRRCLPNRPTHTTHTQSIRGGPEYHPQSSVQHTVQSSSCCSDRTTRCAQGKARLAWFLDGTTSGSKRGSKRGSKLGAAAAQEGAEASGLLGLWVWGWCFLRFSTAAGPSVVLQCIGSWFYCTIDICHS
jgi:hypothetical protein